MDEHPHAPTRAHAAIGEHGEAVFNDDIAAAMRLGGRGVGVLLPLEAVVVARALAATDFGEATTMVGEKMTKPM